MDETLKRRLVGIGVISLLVLIVAWWLPDREDGQKRLNPETLPTETRVYDINQLDKQEPQLAGDQGLDAEAGPESSEPEGIDPDFGQALNEGATVAEAAGSDASASESDSDDAQAEDIDAEPAATKEPAIKPAPVSTTATKPKTSKPQQTAKAETPKPAAEAEPEEPAPKPVVDGDWLVQVGSYSKQSNAESMRKRIAAKGYRVFITSAQVGGTSYHRVRVGPYPAKSDANSAADRLRQLLGQNVAVMAND